MALLFACTEADSESWVDPALWCEALSAELPDLELRVWPDYGDPSGVEFALVWGRVARELDRFANLSIIFSLGAGVEHLMVLPELPDGVPVVRMVDPALRAGMIEFVVHRVLHHYRRIPEYEAQQRDRRWRPLAQRLAHEQPVGVMGLGELGSAVARALAGLGFDTAGWSRTRKPVDGVTCYDGADGLFPFLQRSDILVCLLPLTRATRGILNARLFSALPRGAYLINVARGAHLVDDDLLAALSAGALSGATLDVFHEEPLPADHPFWRHPKIAVVPHVAAQTHAATAARSVADNIRRFRRGEALQHVVDPKRGY